MKALILLSIVTLAIGLPLVYEIGLVMEWEYPHWWMLHHVRDARTVSGEPVAAALQRHFGPEARTIHWHTCGYCIDRTGRSENLRHVQFDVRGHFFSFAYDAARNQLAPMSEATVKEFPELVPPGDLLVPIGGRVGDDSLLLPATWRTR
jgi:hypothetical protein